jgi:23S rRNA (cytidine1920-2'-O)/16S rRNA (cytidine1409-2'-O)-methyltransferase
VGHTESGPSLERLDQALVRRGLARSRSAAQELIRTGRVRVGGVPTHRPAHRVTAEEEIEADQERYVSRGAYKLLGALDDLQVPVAGRALDAGASTGGFTQVLLERGCDRVYAIDVGTRQLASTLRADARVVVREQTNLRFVTLADVDDVPIDILVADVSFISLRLLVPVFARLCGSTGQMLLLVKPQFEVGRGQLGKLGVVRSAAEHRAAVDGVADAAQAAGWRERGRAESRLVGPAGNREFFLHLVRSS